MQNWFDQRKTPLHLVGASAGAWRMLSYCLPDRLDAIDRFLQYYVEQQYETYPTPREVSDKVEEIIQQILNGQDVDALSQNTNLRLYVISTMMKYVPPKKRNYYLQFGKVAMKNIVSRNWLTSNVERVVFTNAPEDQILKPDQFATSYHRLTQDNVISGLRSTGTIPFLMEPVSPHHSPNHLLWDGALVDYHIGLDYKVDGLIFYPHFVDHLTEGWFDKMIPWRKFKGSVLERMIMISPTKSYIQSLPGGKIPDREDFKLYMNDDKKRISHWYQAAEMGSLIAEEFDDLWKAGRFLEDVELF